MSVPASRVDIHLADNLDVLRSIPDGSVDLIYIDPPFNTGKHQTLTQVRVERDPDGGMARFNGFAYRQTVVGSTSYLDIHDDYIEFVAPRLEQAKRVLKPTGSIFVHLDYREVHYVKVLMDSIWGRESFINEIVWAYDYGARTKKRWPAKHDTILWYANDPAHYTFNFEEIDRIPYMAPKLVGEHKAAAGKTPTDTWWHTIVPTAGPERTGYPTQKPLGILRRIVAVHSNPGDLVLDFFAGSGTTGHAAAELGRDVILVDSNQQAFEVMCERLERFEPHLHRR